MIGDALIVDGGIRARHIGANEVTADKINVTNLEAVNANTGNLKATGAIYGGGYTTAHAGNNDTWPASGVTGFALSANGLKIGNKTNNKFIRITPDGNLYAPTWSSVNGKLTISELDVIGTENLIDGSVSGSASVQKQTAESITTTSWATYLTFSFSTKKAAVGAFYFDFRQDSSKPPPYKMRILLNGVEIILKEVDTSTQLIDNIQISLIMDLLAGNNTVTFQYMGWATFARGVSSASLKGLWVMK